MAKFFGFEITRSKKKGIAFSPPENDDGAIPLAPGGAYGAYINMDGSIKSEIELITKYRELSLQAEVDAAVDDIVNEAIVISDERESVVNLELKNLGAPDTIKEKIYAEWEYLVDLLDFDKKGYEIFRKWYVDGRLFYHMIINEKRPKQGIQELRFIDPRKIRKIRETSKRQIQTSEGKVDVVSDTKEWFLYNEKMDLTTADNQKGIKINPDAIAHVNSGLFQHGKNVIISHLHKAIKPINQLRMMEDALVIYRISRAPERRIFYIDVGNLPKAKAEQYLTETMNRYRNKLVYDASTGELKDERKHMSMLEDFWLPRREGGRGTEISTLPGGQNLGELEDVSFFQTKVYKALNVPPSRLESDSGFSLGRESEINRDEMKFSKFVSRLRNKFTEMFDQMLKAQLVLKGVLKIEDWEKFRPQIQYKWTEDSYYREIKKSEMLSGRLNILRDISEYAGRYFSMDWIKRELLSFTDEEVTQMRREIEAEVNSELLARDATIEWGDSGTNFNMEEEGTNQPSDVAGRNSNSRGGMKSESLKKTSKKSSEKQVYAKFKPEDDMSINTINDLFDELDNFEIEEEMNE